MRKSVFIIAAFVFTIALPQSANCGVASTAIRDSAEAIFSKFGRGAAGKTIEEVTETTAKVVARHGEEALPLLRKSGYAGIAALEEAGDKAPDVIKLFARKGDEAIWIISEPKKLAIFFKHGDSAADALLKHPGIADRLIGRFGGDAAGALNNLSREGAQHLNMIADDGLLTSTKRSSELIRAIREYGDEAMDFIWKNKGSLTVTSVLATFLADPQAYISGAKQLVVSPIVQRTNWTLMIAGVLIVVFLPFITRSILKARMAMRPTKTNT